MDDPEYKLSDMGQVVLQYLVAKNWKPSLNVVFKGKWVRKEDVNPHSHFNNKNYYKNAKSYFKQHLYEYNDPCTANQEHCTDYQKSQAASKNSFFNMTNNGPIHYGPHGDTAAFASAHPSQSIMTKDIFHSTPKNNDLAAEIIQASQQAVADFQTKKPHQVSNINYTSTSPQTGNKSVSLKAPIDSNFNGDVSQLNSTDERPMFCFLSPSLTVSPPPAIEAESVTQRSPEHVIEEAGGDMESTQTTITCEVNRLVDKITRQENDTGKVRWENLLSPQKTTIVENMKADYTTNESKPSDGKEAKIQEKVIESSDSRGLMGPPVHRLKRCKMRRTKKPAAETDGALSNETRSGPTQREQILPKSSLYTKPTPSDITEDKIKLLDATEKSRVYMRNKADDHQQMKSNHDSAPSVRRKRDNGYSTKRNRGSRSSVKSKHEINLSIKSNQANECSIKSNHDNGFSTKSNHDDGSSTKSNHDNGSSMRSNHDNESSMRSNDDSESSIKSNHDNRLSIKSNHDNISSMKSNHDNKSPMKSNHDNKSSMKPSHDNGPSKKSNHDNGLSIKSNHDNRSPMKSNHDNISPMKSNHDNKSSMKPSHDNGPSKKSNHDSGHFVQRNNDSGSSKNQDQDSGSCIKRRRFVAPVKKPVGVNEHGCVETVSPARLSALTSSSANVSAVSLCLEYGDGSSSLRPSAATLCKPIALVSALNGRERITVRLSLSEQQEEAWQCVSTLLTRQPQRRVVCYDVKQLMLLTLQHSRVERDQAVKQWRVSDPHVAGWLVQPDKTARTFSELLTQLGESSGRDCRLSRLQQISADLQLLSRADQVLEERLEELQLMEVYRQLEVPLTPLLACMQYVGMCVDTGLLHRTASLCQQRLQQLQRSAHQAVGSSFQLTSAAQLRRVIYDQLQLHKTAQLSSVKLTGGGERSTSEPVLLALSHVHPLPDLVLQYRRLHKLKSTYVDGVLSHVRGSAVHPRWLQTAAATGRVQAASPNVQSVPRQPLAVPPCEQLQARAMFLAGQQHQLLSADFQQMELRLLAHLSADSTLIAALHQTSPNSDIFRRLSSEWNGRPLSSVTPADREHTKRVVYAAMYGVGGTSLAETLHCSCEEAQRLIDSFRAWCPAIATFWKDTVQHCSKHGYVTSLLGRKRWISSISSANKQERQHAERQAVNFRVQGSAADVCKLTSLAISEVAGSVPLIAQLHDELVWQVPEQRVEHFRQTVLETVERLPELLGRYGLREPLSVSLPVSVSQGSDWAHLVRVTE